MECLIGRAGNGRNGQPRDRFHKFRPVRVHPKKNGNELVSQRRSNATGKAVVDPDDRDWCGSDRRTACKNRAYVSRFDSSRRSSQLVQIIRPRLHHAPSFGQMRCSVV